MLGFQAVPTAGKVHKHRLRQVDGTGQARLCWAGGGEAVPQFGLLTMGLHAIWDFSVFIQDHSVQNLKDKPLAPGGLVLNLTIILGIVALVKILKTGDVVEPGGDQLPEFDMAT